MPLPRVTEILAAVGLEPDFSDVPPERLEAARRRGTAVHEVIEVRTYGYEGTVLCDPETVPYLNAHHAFCQESGYRAEVAEVEIIHPTWRYRGHPDSIGWLREKRALLDWKTTEALVLKPVRLQLAAYWLAWNASHPTEPLHAVMAVQLKRDGTYRVHDIDVHAALPVWLAAVTLWWAKEES